MQGTPQQQIEWMMEQYRSGQADAAACGRGLDAVEAYFHQKASELDRSGAPEEDLAEATQAFQLFMDSVAHLRAHLAGDAGALDEGLSLAAQGQLAVEASLEANAERRKELRQRLDMLRAAGAALVSETESLGRLEG